MLEDDRTPLERTGLTRGSRGWDATEYAALDSLAQPDCILPSQFYGRRRAASNEGEIRLLIAVLQDAINTYARTVDGKTKRQREDFEEVDCWFNGTNQQGLFAFENVCEVLEVEAHRVRRWLQSLSNGGAPAGTEGGAVRKRRRWRLNFSHRLRRPRPLRTPRGRARHGHARITSVAARRGYN